MVQKLLIFVEGGAGRGGGVEMHLCTLSTHTRTLQMDRCSTQQRQKIIKQMTKTCKASTVNINLPLKGLTDFTRSFFKGTTSYDVLARLSSCQIRIFI